MILFGKKLDKYFWIKLFLFVAFMVFAFTRAKKETDFGDFHVFWLAGKTLLEGGDIYYVAPGLRAFIYPPFAAILFIPLALLPFKIACFFFFLVNLFCFIFTVQTVKKILALYINDEKILKYSQYAAIALIFKISWNNLMMVQVNQLLYVFVVLGIYNFLTKKENWAIFYFCIAISMKVFPILFAFWVVIRGSKLAVPKFVLGAIICIVLPFLFTGPTKGIQQLDWFYNDFILPQSKSKSIGFGYASQSLTSLINRTVVKSQLTTEPNYALIDIGEPASHKIISIVQLSLFLLMCSVFLYSRVKKLNLNMMEPSLVILICHLISSATWKAHMVGMILVYIVIASDIIKRYQQSSLGFITKLFVLYMAFVSLFGQILIGKKLQMHFNAYGDHTFAMIFCLIYILYMFKKECQQTCGTKA